MALPVLAHAYLNPSRNYVLMTTPGRRVEFRGGHAQVVDHRDMPHVLRLPEVTVEVEEKWVDWLPGWLQALDEFHPPKATVHIPAGFAITPWPECTLTRGDAPTPPIDPTVGKTVAIKPGSIFPAPLEEQLAGWEVKGDLPTTIDWPLIADLEPVQKVHELTATAKPKKAKKKRVMGEAQKQKLREMGKARWAEKQALAAAGA